MTEIYYKPNKMGKGGGVAAYMCTVSQMKLYRSS